jgi:hypothetical protein
MPFASLAGTVAHAQAAYTGAAMLGVRWLRQCEKLVAGDHEPTIKAHGDDGGVKGLLGRQPAVTEGCIHRPAKGRELEQVFLARCNQILQSWVH